MKTNATAWYTGHDTDGTGSIEDALAAWRECQGVLVWLRCEPERRWLAPRERASSARGQTGEDMERAIESLSVQHEATELVQADVEEVRPLVALAEHGCCR
jgi:hypothetical protein